MILDNPRNSERSKPLAGMSLRLSNFLQIILHVDNGFVLSRRRFYTQTGRFFAGRES